MNFNRRLTESPAAIRLQNVFWRKFMENPTVDKLLPLPENYSRVAQIFRGLVPSVRSIGIVTAENPMGSALPRAENETKNAHLRSEIKRGNYGFHRLTGKYGEFENPFLILNIKRKALYNLADNANQKAFIYGFSAYPNPEYHSMTFELHERQFAGHRFGITSTRKVFVSAQNAEDFYSKISGHKFVIPFFDDTYEDAEFLGGAVVKLEAIPKTDKTKELIEGIEGRLDQLWETDGGGEGFGNWGSRGVIRQKARQLKDLSEGIVHSEQYYISGREKKNETKLL